MLEGYPLSTSTNFCTYPCHMIPSIVIIYNGTDHHLPLPLICALEPIQRILRCKDLPLVRKIHQHKIRRPAIQTLAERGLRTDTTRARRRVRGGRGRPIGDQDAQDVHIEEVVDDVHAAGGGRAGGAVDAAVRKGGVRHVVGRFEEVRKFVEDVWHAGHVRSVIFCSQPSLALHRLSEVGYGIDCYLEMLRRDGWPG